MSVLQGLVDVAFPMLPAEFIVLCREDVARALNGSRKNVTLLSTNSLAGGFLLCSALREQIAVRKLARDHRCDLLLVIGSAGVLFPPCPQILVVLNRLYLSEKYRRRLAELSRVRSWLISAKGHFLRYSSCHCSLLMTESQAMKSLICLKWGLPPNRVEVLHKGINTSLVIQTPRQPKQTNAPPVILCVSHFALYKGFETLVAAASELERSGREFSLWIVGQQHWSDRILAEARGRLDALLEASGAKRCFRFLGALSPAEVASAYRQADLCVFPSWCESYPNPVPESLANGIPIVAADIDINHELAGDAALYFQPENPTELADRIALLIASPAIRHSLSERALERAQEFTWRRSADDLWRAVRRALGEDRVPASVAIGEELQ